MPFRARKDGTVSDNTGKRLPLCHSDRSVSGVEESTTLRKEPPQDKTCCLGRFLGSLCSLGMTCGGVVPFNRTGYKRNVAGGRLPPLRSRWGVVPFNHTGSSRYVSGTAHRPFPTVSLVDGIFHPHRLYSGRGGRQVAAPTDTPVGGVFQPHRL